MTGRIRIHDLPGSGSADRARLLAALRIYRNAAAQAEPTALLAAALLCGVPRHGRRRRARPTFRWSWCWATAVGQILRGSGWVELMAQRLAGIAALADLQCQHR
jgi:hypothetical protein